MITTASAEAVKVASLPSYEAGEIHEFNSADSGDNYNKSTRQLLIEWYDNDNRRKSVKDIQARFPTLRREEMRMMLMFLPNAWPSLLEDGEIVWDLQGDCDFAKYDLDSPGLFGYVGGCALKADLVTDMGHTHRDISYVDKEDDPVTDRIEFAWLCGFDLVSTVTSNGNKIRTFSVRELPQEMKMMELVNDF